MNQIKDEISEKLAQTAINYTKETVKEVIKEDLEKGDLTSTIGADKRSSIQKNKELHEATQEIFWNTKDYIDKNKDNIMLITKNFADIASKVIDKTKEKVKESYDKTREDEIDKMNSMDDGKKIIIDATTGEKKDRLNNEINYGAMNFDKFFNKDYSLRNLKADIIVSKETTALRYLDFTKDKHLKKQ